MTRILIDTNVLVAAAYNRRSASRRILEAIESGMFTLLVSPRIRREYAYILPRAVRSESAREAIWQLLDKAEQVTPDEIPAVTEDRSDDKFLAAAVTGRAAALISSDEHLLSVHPHAGVEILTPTAFWNRFGDSD